MSDMRSFIKVEHSRFTLILRKGMLPFHWIAESHVYPDKGYVTAVRERTNYGAVWALSSCAQYAAEHDRISGYPLQGVWGGVNRNRRRNRNE